MKALSLILALWALEASTQNCSRTYDVDFSCPSDFSVPYAVCEGDSLTSNIILRCIDGCVQPGNCNDNLASAPPVGVKRSALCYEDSHKAGNAQCTYDCVKVTALNGSDIYPVGCSFSKSNSTDAPVSTSINLGGSTASKTTAAPSATKSSSARMRLDVQSRLLGSLVAVPVAMSFVAACL